MYQWLCSLALASSLIASSAVSIAGDGDLIKLINDQLKPCAKLPGHDGKSDLPQVTVKFALKRDGHLDGAVTVIDAQKDALFKLAAEASVRAVKECAPYSLPSSRYDTWSEVTWTFDWAAIVGRVIEAPPAASPGSSAVQRPPGITRSGENDEFARNVIRALQKTMPRQEGQFGRVTVRIVVPENSSPPDVKVLKSGGNGDLDSNVMFAARQTAYPLPPKNSTVADRTFIVTYVYK